MWAAVFVVADPSTIPAFQVRVQVATLIQGGLLLFNILWDSMAIMIRRLRRRAQGHQGSHDDPSVELPGHGRVP